MNLYIAWRSEYSEDGFKLIVAESELEAERLYPQSSKVFSEPHCVEKIEGLGEIQGEARVVYPGEDNIL